MVQGEYNEGSLTGFTGSIFGSSLPSFVSRVRISSPSFLPPFLTLPLSLATPGYFLRLSSFFSLLHPHPLYSYVFFYYFLPQLSTQGHYVTGTMPANEDCGKRLLIPCSKLHDRMIETAHFDYRFQHPLLLSIASCPLNFFVSPSTGYIHTFGITLD